MAPGWLSVITNTWVMCHWATFTYTCKRMENLYITMQQSHITVVTLINNIQVNRKNRQWRQYNDRTMHNRTIDHISKSWNALGKGNGIILGLYLAYNSLCKASSLNSCYKRRPHVQGARESYPQARKRPQIPERNRALWSYFLKTLNPLPQSSTVHVTTNQSIHPSLSIRPHPPNPPEKNNPGCIGPMDVT